MPKTIHREPISVLGTSIAQRRLSRITQDNPSRLGLFKAVYSGTHNKAQAVKAFCLECQGFDSVGVKECGDMVCPLWKFRPFQTKKPALSTG